MKAGVDENKSRSSEISLRIKLEFSRGEMITVEDYSTWKNENDWKYSDLSISQKLYIQGKNHEIIYWNGEDQKKKKKRFVASGGNQRFCFLLTTLI